MRKRLRVVRVRAPPPVRRERLLATRERLRRGRGFGPDSVLPVVDLVVDGIPRRGDGMAVRLDWFCGGHDAVVVENEAFVRLMGEIW